MSDFPTIPGFRIVKMLGQGGMADVYEAVQENLDRRVAIKVIIPDLFRDTSFSARFVKEAQTAAKLSHQHVLHIYDVGATRNCHYIVMECLQKSLKERLKQGALAPDVALRIMLTMGQALDYAHQKGFVHRDIKPDNILFREDGTPVLTDFGIVKALDSTTKLTRTGMWVGTPHYMSPEQIRGADIDGRADFYSLGIVFYEMLIGKVPYEATDPIAVCMKQMNEPLPVLPASLSRYQPLLEGLLAKDPEQRVASSGELQKLIDGLISVTQKTSEKKEPSGPRPETDKAHHTISLKTLAYNFRDRAAAVGKNRHRLVPWLGGSLVVVMLIVVVVWNKQSNNANVGAIPPIGDKHETPLKLPETKITQTQPEDPETIKKREQLAANEAEKQQLAAAEAEKQRLAAEQAKNKRIVQEEIKRQALATEKQRLAAEATKKQQTQPVQNSSADIPPNKELQRIGLFELDSQLAREYGQKFQRVNIPAVSKSVNAFGQISVLLNVDASGRISIHSLDIQMLTVDPVNQQAQVRTLLSRAFTQAQLLPPKDRNGQAVILEKWRLSFKIVTLSGKMTLIKQ
jgi:tRNA A-37 threonylcarbamoyl transferase component Bud32